MTWLLKLNLATNSTDEMSHFIYKTNPLKSYKHLEAQNSIIWKELQVLGRNMRNYITVYKLLVLV